MSLHQITTKSDCEQQNQNDTKYEQQKIIPQTNELNCEPKSRNKGQQILNLSNKTQKGNQTNPETKTRVRKNVCELRLLISLKKIWNGYENVCDWLQRLLRLCELKKPWKEEEKTIKIKKTNIE